MAQKPGSVEGTVSNSVTGAPVRKALVTLRRWSRNEGYQALTGVDGRFRFDGVQAGTYGLWAEAQGYVRDSGRFFAPSQMVTLAEDKTIKDFAIRLEPTGSISGKVVDADGEPVAGARVNGLIYSYSGSGPSLGAYASATTNERGEYRLFDLQPGRWYVRVDKTVAQPIATGRVHRIAAEAEYGYTYYPGVTQESEAAGIEVGPGAELEQIEIRVRRARVYHLRGRVVDGRSGQGVAKADVYIQELGHVESHADGVFDARGVPAGVYRVTAAVKADVWLFSAPQEMVVGDRDVNDLAIRLAPGITVQGTASAVQGAQVTLEPIGGGYGTARGVVQDDGTFAIADVAPHAYRVSVERRGMSAYLKSVRCGSQDGSDTAIVDIAPGAPLTLEFASDGGSVEGAVQSAGPGPAPVVVTAAPAGRRAGRMDLLKTVDTDSGAFRLEGLAPGDYKLFAWELKEEGLAEYAPFRQLLDSQATAVTVHADERQSVRLSVITAAEVEQARRKLP
jgi:protocatechuate 3,4-dioxygenase beta subunit